MVNEIIEAIFRSHKIYRFSEREYLLPPPSRVCSILAEIDKKVLLVTTTTTMGSVHAALFSLFMPFAQHNGQIFHGNFLLSLAEWAIYC